MADAALVLLVTVAIAIGFFLGRRSTRKPNPTAIPLAFNKTYFQGLNHLLNEQPDKAVDAFVNSLEVNADTLETHLAMGKLMRKQGQVDRAIRIHQNLLARPRLDVEHQHQVHLELARDFIAAGLFDRAEMLLKEVISESTQLRSIAQRYLLDIFQDEREWNEAIRVAEALSLSKYVKGNTAVRHDLSQTIAQFYCELAEEAAQKNDTGVIRKLLERAYSADKNCIRASILMGGHENGAERFKQAIRVLSRVAVQKPSRLADCLPELYKAYVAQDPAGGFNQFVNYVETHLKTHPSTDAMLFLVEQLIVRSEFEPARRRQANEILSSYVKDHPSLAGLGQLISLQLPNLSGPVANDVRSLQGVVSHLIQKRMIYQCTNCGFSGRQLHWRCPSCKQWDAMDRLKGKDVE